MGLGWPTVVMVVTTKLYVHFLGVRIFAVYAAANAALALAGVLRLGAAEATVKFVAQHRQSNDHARLASTLIGTLLLYTVAACLGGAVLWVGAGVAARDFLHLAGNELLQGRTAIRITAVAFPASLLLSAATSLFSGLERYDISTRLSSAASTFAAIVGSVIVISGGTVVDLMTGTCAVLWLAAPTAVFLALRHVGIQHVSMKQAVREIRVVLAFSAFSSLNTLCSTIFLTADRFVVGAILGAEAVTYYSVAAQVSSRIYTVTIALTQALLPRFSAYRTAGANESMRRLYVTAHLSVVLFATGLAGIFAACGHWVFEVWLGASFAAGAALPFTVLTFSFSVLAITLVSYYFLNGIGEPGISARWYLTSCALGFGVMIVAGKHFGFPGILAGSITFTAILLGQVFSSIKILRASRTEIRRGLVLTVSSTLIGIAAGAAGFMSGLMTQREVHSILIAGPISFLVAAGIVALFAGTLYRRREPLLEPVWRTLDGLVARLRMTPRVT